MAGVGVSEFWLRRSLGGLGIRATGSRGVFSRASAGHKRKSLVKIGEVTPPKRPPILGPLELGEPVSGLVPPPPRKSRPIPLGGGPG